MIPEITICIGELSLAISTFKSLSTIIFSTELQFSPIIATIPDWLTAYAFCINSPLIFNSLEHSSNDKVSEAVKAKYSPRECPSIYLMFRESRSISSLNTLYIDIDAQNIAN